MTLDALTAQEQSELERILEARLRQQSRLDNRIQLIRRSDDVLRIASRIHLLDAELERELDSLLIALDNRIAVLKHSRLDRPDRAAMSGDLLSTAREQRGRLAAMLAERRKTVHLELVPGLLGTKELQVANLPSKVVRRARQLSVELQLAAVRVVDVVVDSELLQLSQPRSAEPGSTAIFRCADSTAETAERILAFVDEIARIGSIRDAAAERLRFEALHKAAGPVDSWLAGQTVRVAAARSAIDSLRAMHAAIAEVEAICPA